MKDFLTTAWDIVNKAETISEIASAEGWVRSNVTDNDLFDELMMTLAFKSREAYKH